MKYVRWVSIGVVVLALAVLSLRLLVIRIKPGQIGILNAEWTGGLVEQDFGAGYHWDIGPLHTWRVFDGTVQSMQFNRRPEAAARTDDADIHGALQLKSKRGATINLDVTLKYRIKPSRGWQLAKSLGTAYKDVVRNVALDVLRASLGELEAENFYDPRMRQDTATKMEDQLRSQLDDKQVELIAILIRDLEFDSRFEERIKQKTLASEEQELNKAQTLAEEMRGKTLTIEAETGALVVIIDQEKEKTMRKLKADNDKAIRSIIAEYRKSVRELESDADLYAALREAEGIRLLAEAEATGQSLRREAMSSTGGAVLVALQLARNLQLGDMTISTQAVNPLDIEAMIARFGVPETAAAQPGANR